MHSNNPSHTTVHWADNAREVAFLNWLDARAQEFSLNTSSLRLASADASFRRYFRIDHQEPSKGSFIIMDAPPEKESCEAFVHVAQLMQSAKLLVPSILQRSKQVGFMLITDLGSHTLLEKLNEDLDLSSHQPTPPLKYFAQALDSLILWQSASTPGVLAPYDSALLHRELQLFPYWYIHQHLGINLSTDQLNSLHSVFESIVTSNLSAPSVFVHRDFMPRNLMIPRDPAENRLGILDFQDAVFGPLTYDIASLMRDAFCSWSDEFVIDITVRYWERIRRTGLIDANGWSTDFGEFWRAVEWMGLQRHLKVAGIFARLSLRDQKPKYLADTPRFINYIQNTASRYKELFPLIRLLDSLTPNNSSQASLLTYGRI